MSTIKIDTANIKQHIARSGITVLDFWAEWCGPCRFFGPIFEKASERHSDVVFGKVNTEEDQDLARMFGIQSIPTLMAFRDGLLLYNEPGALPEAALESLLTQIRALDMDELRRGAQKSAET